MWESRCCFPLFLWALWGCHTWACSLTTSFKQKTEVVLREPSELSPLPHGCQGVRLPFLPVLAGGSVFSPGKKDTLHNVSEKHITFPSLFFFFSLNPRVPCSDILGALKAGFLFFFLPYCFWASAYLEPVLCSVRWCHVLCWGETQLNNEESRQCFSYDDITRHVRVGFEFVDN